MTSNVEIWNLLNKVKVSAVKQSQHNEMTSRVAVDKDAVEFWSGVITVARAIGESRTFAHGLPIYDTGSVSAEEIDNLATNLILPTGTEVWQILNIDLQGCTGYLRDISTGSMSQLTSSTFQSGQMYLSSTLALYLDNQAGSAKTTTIAYYKLSL